MMSPHKPEVRYHAASQNVDSLSSAKSRLTSIFIDGIIFSLQRQGGISVYFHQLLKYLSSRNVQATLGIELPTQQDFGQTGQSISHDSRPARRLERYRPCRTRTHRTLFHSSYYRLPDRRDTPTIVTVHDFIYERFSKGPRRWIHIAQKHAAIRAAQVIICVSESTRQDLLQWIGETPGQQLLVIHNGVSDTFRPLQMESLSIPFLLYVGARNGYKNFRLVLGALSLLPDLELHCVGGGALRPEELASASPSVRARVRHLGFVSDDALNEIYNRALCLVYPSSYEGFGIPVAEAMRAGCPVVCTNCKAVLEVGGGALTVAAEATAHAIADAIIRTDLSAYRETIVQTGLALAQKYSWQVTHHQTLEAYRSLGASLVTSN